VGEAFGHGPRPPGEPRSRNVLRNPKRSSRYRTNTPGAMIQARRERAELSWDDPLAARPFGR